MDISVAKIKIEETLSQIAKDAGELGLYAKFGARYEKKDFTPCELHDKKLAYLSGEALIFAAEGDEDHLAFGVSVECKSGEIDEAELTEELEFAKASAATFLEELAEAEDKELFARRRIAEERELAEKTLAEVDSQVSAARRVSLIATAVGVGIVFVAALLIFLL